jgi:CO/xanthine dehydrogenase Mo-binding subunit
VPTIAATLARAVGRPVKFVEDRMDNIMSSDNHASDRIYEAELAVKDGMMTGLRFAVIDDYGAYLQYGYGTHGNALSQVTGPYKIIAKQSPKPNDPNFINLQGIFSF